MGKAKSFLFGSLLGAATMFGAMQFHVVRSHDGFQFVPRTPQHSLGLAYADIRNWNASQWTDRPELARALMAHGSSGLIAESVADSLADSVSSESATMDQLRSFLNKATEGLDSAEETQTFKIPGIEPLKFDGVPGSKENGTAPLNVPLPSEAKRPSASDAFRVADSEPAAVPAPATGSKSRFSAEDILGGEESPFSEVQPTRTNSPGTGNSGSQGSKPSGKVPSSVKESKPFIDEVFGPSASNSPSSNPATSANGPGVNGPGANGPGVNGGNATTVARTSSTAGTGSPKPSATPAGNTPSANPSSASPRPVNAFEDVTADLESRARSALSRAQSSLQGKAADATEAVKESAGQFVRDQANSAATSASEAATKAAKSNGSEETLRAIREKFDPFLE